MTTLSEVFTETAFVALTMKSCFTQTRGEAIKNEILFYTNKRRGYQK
jgi:hypothetical protein